MPDYSQGFGPKADVYAQYRWDYAAEAIDQVCAIAGLGPASTVADVGAGTGLLSAHFLRRGTRVVAVEPNAGMLRVAQQALGHEPRFSALPGFAHATGLDEASVDLIAVGRALHWFDHVPTRAEFLRVLRPGGWLAVLQTPTTDPYLVQEMARLRSPETGWKMERSKHHLAQASLGFYFGTENYQTLIVPSRVLETWEQFFGRVSSLSPAPNPGQPLYAVFERTARDIFERGAVNGLLPVEYSTTVTLHALKPATLAPTPTSTSHPAPLPFERGEVERSIGERFERVVARFPDRIALQAAGATWTYTRLNEFSDQVARAVTALSPDSGRPIVLFFEHEPEAIGALLGVLKSGRAYCALRPNLPPARLRETVADLDARVLLCSPGALAEAQALAALRHVVNVSALPESDAPFRVPPVTPETLGGVFYTSGTTGRPKGVMRSQGMLLHRAWSSSRLLGVTPHDRFSQCFGISFGASIVDIFVALLNGASLHPYAASQLGVAPLGAWLEQDQITVLHLPVAFYRQFLDGLTPHDHFTALRRITPSGKLFWSDVARSRPHFAPECRLVSQFSSTETSLLTWMLVDPSQAGQGTSVPVGLPVADKEVWLAGDDGRPVAPGAVGEITVRSRYLSAGFWRQPELTRERFTPAPDDPRLVTYRMGDLGRWREDGTLEFLGRSDDQLKVRGFRVDLSEVEAGLYRTGLVAQAALAVREDGLGEKQIVAYVVPAVAEAGLQALRQALAGLLPDYMLPSRFVRLAPGEMPLTPNGKVDQSRLPPVGDERPDLETEYAAPRTELERQLAVIWEDVLRVPAVGVHDPFVDLGGNSLLAAQVAVRARQRLGVDLPLTVLLSAGTVAHLAAAIERLRGANPDGAALPERFPQRPDPSQPAPLIFAQEGLWFLQQLEPEASLYNQPKLLRLHGQLNRAALEQALNGLVHRHPALRTVVRVFDGQPFQLAQDPASVTLRLPVFDCRAEAEPEAAAREQVRRLSRAPFDLSGDVLLRAALLTVGDDDYWLLLVTHHGTGDLWSTGILWRELSAWYAAALQGYAPALPALHAEPADFAVWQRTGQPPEKRERLRAYWVDKLAGAPFVELPSDFRRPAQRRYHGQRVVLRLPLSDETRQAMQRLQRAENATLFMLLLAVFKTLLLRYTGQSDLVVGSPMTNRPHPDLEGVVGMFANNLVLRTELAGAAGFRQALRRVRQTALEAYDHQDLAFQELIGLVKPERAGQRHLLFEIMFGLQNVPETTPALEALRIERLTASTHAARLEQTWLLFEEPAGLRLDLEYSTECFRAETVERMWTHFGNLLEAAVRDPDGDLPSLPILSAAELAQFAAWNDTAAPYPVACIHELFSRQAERTPHAPALLSCVGPPLTYAELEARSTRLAQHLVARGLQPGGRAGLYLPRAPGSVVALLAVLKAGAAYVPLDPAYPAERLAFMCQDAGLTSVLTVAELRPALEALLSAAGLANVSVVVEEAVPAAGNAAPVLPHGQSPDQPMYVLYTSGSTGQPKGVVGLHRGLVNRLAWMWQAFPFLPGEVLAHKTTLSFLDSAWEIFGPLLAGVPSVVVPEAVLLDPLLLVNTLARFQVSRLVLVPSLLRGLLERFSDLGERLPKLRLWTSSGEALPADLAQTFHRVLPEATLINLYGTTEVSADATCYVTRPDEDLSNVPIGRPIANMQAHVLDPHQQPAPVGVPGEVYLGGVGLAQGYLGWPDQTDERFPTLRVPSGDPRRLFRTGDLARWLPDGTLEYLGRADDQVKLRGVRVELGEIEAVLRQAPQVRQAVVAVAEQGGERVLAAYIVPHTRAGDEAQHAASLARHLTTRLPRTMLPASYTFLAELPLTPSGKVDRPRLPAPHPAVGEASPPSEADSVEARLCRVWEAVLGVAPIGPHDNFFALGGHSLHAFRLFAHIEKEFGQILPVVLLFESPTPAGLAVNLRTRRPSPAPHSPAVIPIQPRGDRPPFFCVHGFGGGVLGYADLARGLGPDQPFFGLQALGFNGHAAPHTSIPEMAEYYLDQLRRLEPHGPYHLGGYCFGGVVAYEMACRLQAEGEQVGLLAVIEGFAPRRVREPLSFTNPRHIANFLRNLPFWLGDLLSLSASQAAQQARGRLRLLLRHPASAGAGRLEQHLPAALLGDDAWRVPAATRRLMELHILAQAAYQPPFYPGRLDLFRVPRLSLLRGHDPLLGWGKLAQAGVCVHLVAGRHNSLHLPPHVASLAAALRAALEASPFVFSVPD